MIDILRAWTFKSSSSNKEYETLQYTDGSTSCIARKQSESQTDTFVPIVRKIHWED